MFFDRHLKDKSLRPLLDQGKKRSIFSSHKPLSWHQKRLLHLGSSIQFGLFASVIFTLMIIIVVTSYLFYGTTLSALRNIPQVTFKCESSAFSKKLHHFRHHINLHALNHGLVDAKVNLDSKVLLFVESLYSKLGRVIMEVLEATRTKFKLEVLGKSLPMLANSDRGKFAVVIFENLRKYLHMNKWNRDILDKYCREYHVGIIGFVPISTANVSEIISLKGLPMKIIYGAEIRDYLIKENSSVLRITKSGYLHKGHISDKNFTVFYAKNSSYEYVTKAFLSNNHDNSTDPHSFNTSSEVTVSTLLHDTGSIDGIQRIFFSNGLDFWADRLLLLDSLSYLSHGKFSRPLQRHILIDIDDIFVGEQGTRLRPNDVEALIDSQNRIQNIIPGFRFNLGFSGKYFHRGNPLEDEGDDLLVQNAHLFWWFCHMWGHSQAHLTDNTTTLETLMRMNREFAIQKNLSIDSGYSVAPHHSGVYPVHEPLYEAWKNVWNIKATSTEEYPHLRPARLRRGFIHRGVMVLPRQTCGLYTHTIFIDKYPGGRSKLDQSIHGGELFYLFVFNQINVFMTHMSNYGNDRLATYAFESVINFVQCKTNIQLKTIPPVKLAIKYFQTYPSESDPIWTNPCKDKRHLSLWSSSKSCSQLPDFLIIGPQKTGTTALYQFLLMHPSVRTSKPSPESFEEVQFFNGKNYYKGLDWYMNFFSTSKNNSTKTYLFEKSATYFDSEFVPMRAHSLLPDAKIITILISPSKRAYSWYQHVKAHRDPVALNYTFYEVIAASDDSPKPLLDLRNRCLNPGFYVNHLEKWINFFSSRKIFIIDGEELKLDPASVLEQVQDFLGIEPFLDYRDHLRYDSHKGYFCQVINTTKTKCLGRSKGRLYPPMDSNSKKYLQSFYLPYNIALSRLLSRINQAFPQWLEQELSSD